MRTAALAVILACAGCGGRPVVKATPAATPPAPRADPAELKRLYDAAVDAYAADRRDEAGRLFRLMLELDPGNAAAAKGLRRLSLEPGR